SSVAVNNAVRAGVVVVASAGNNGILSPGSNDAPYIAGSPAAPDGALAVPAMDAVDPTSFAVVFAGEFAFTMQVSNGSISGLPVEGTLRLLVNDPANTADEAPG